MEDVILLHPTVEARKRNRGPALLASRRMMSAIACAQRFYASERFCPCRARPPRHDVRANRPSLPRPIAVTSREIVLARSRGSSWRQSGVLRDTGRIVQARRDGARSDGQRSRTAMTALPLRKRGSVGRAKPCAVDHVSASSACSPTYGWVTCDLGALAPGESVSVEITVRPYRSGSATNKVSIASYPGGGRAALPDTRPANKTDVRTTQVDAVLARRA